MKSKIPRWFFALALCCLYCAIIFISFSFLSPNVYSWGNGSNYKNYSVRATVNITEAYPELLNVSCNAGQPIVLTAGGVRTVSCLVQILDFNGGNTIIGDNGSKVNATFHYFLNKSSDPDDGNVHYTNTSCALNGSASGFYVNWTCSFGILYYAYNGSWRINVTVFDTHNDKNLTVDKAFNASITPLYALNVTSPIDYGSLAMGDTSPALSANVTNFGNMNINVSLYGYGGETDTAAARTLSMICDERNLTRGNERFSLNGGASFDTMNVLPGAYAPIAGLTIPKQEDDAIPNVNTTYWRLHVNATENPYGICNGTIVFSAELP